MKKKTPQYLFRAKFYFSDHWIYGGGIWTFADGTKMIGEDRHGEIIINDVKPETVGQFLIFDDKMKMIFEGDVFEIAIGDKWGGRHLAKHPQVFLLSNRKRVIGNIFDNPKLKEGLSDD